MPTSDYDQALLDVEWAADDMLSMDAAGKRTVQRVLERVRANRAAQQPVYEAPLNIIRYRDLLLEEANTHRGYNDDIDDTYLKEVVEGKHHSTAYVRDLASSVLAARDFERRGGVLPTWTPLRRVVTDNPQA